MRDCWIRLLDRWDGWRSQCECDDWQVQVQGKNVVLQGGCGSPVAIGFGPSRMSPGEYGVAVRVQLEHFAGGGEERAKKVVFKGFVG